MESVEVQAVVTEALTWPDRARACAVVDSPSCVLAADTLKGIKALRARIAETFDPHITRAHQAHKALVAEKSAAEAPLTEAEGIIKRALAVYEQEQQRIARAESDRLAAIARQQEIDRKIAEAVAAEAAGDDETAAVIMDEPIIVAPVVVAPTTPKVAGISYRTTYAAEVTDKAALVTFCASHPQFLHCVSADMTALNALARTMKQTMQIPGVRVVETRTVAAGR
jgi:hypothetical protein